MSVPPRNELVGCEIVYPRRRRGRSEMKLTTTAILRQLCVGCICVQVVPEGMLESLLGL